MNAKHLKPSAQAVVKDIRRAARKQYGAEEKNRLRARIAELGKQVRESDERDRDRTKAKERDRDR